MTQVHRELPNKEFLEDENDGKYNIMLCKDSGQRATPECSHVTGKLYNRTDIPTKRCEKHPYSFNRNDLAKGSTEVTDTDEEVEGIVDDGSDSSTGTDSGTESTPESSGDGGVSGSDLGI